VKPKKVAVVISVYKNVRALSIILEALENQTVKPDEIIISEDGRSQKVTDFVKTLNSDKIIHLTQEDLGWRKNKALNRAILRATTDYLIFIDGDVVPHKRFIEGHISCSKPRRVNAGKRAEIGQKYSEMLYNRDISIDKLTNNYIFWAIKLHNDKIRHYEDGIYIKPDGWIYKNIIQKKLISYLIGCNFSCYKKDIESINGFNEDYKLPAIGEDVDINWRFRADGTEVISCRNIANVYHLWHKKGFGADEGKVNNEILKENFEINRFVCLNGLKKLKDGE